MARESREPLISEEVLRAEYRSVYRYALALCQDESLAQDITQETFLKAMLHGTAFKGKAVSTPGCAPSPKTCGSTA